MNEKQDLTGLAIGTALIAAGLALALCQSCAPASSVPVVSISVDGQPAWVEEAAGKASTFWAGHGVDLQIVADDQADIHVVLDGLYPEHAGQWRQAPTMGAHKGDVALDPHLGDAEHGAECIVAHEIGHSLGMPHNTSNQFGLMSPTVMWLPKVGGCAWNKEDQTNLCSQNRTICGCEEVPR